MPAIGDMNYGTSSQGVEQIIEDIKSKIITDVSDTASDISEIQTAVNENWSGMSADNFLTNLNADVQKLQESLGVLYTALVSEISAVSTSIMDFDQHLIDNN